jgi:hypothetical protein
VATTKDEEIDEPDVIGKSTIASQSVIDRFQCSSFFLDMTNSSGYYGGTSFPLRPPSPYTEGLIYTQTDNDNPSEMYIWSPSTNQLTVHYNTNNNNNNCNTTESSWKRVWERLAPRFRTKRDPCGRSSDKYQHWMVNEQIIVALLSRFVEHLKVFVQQAMKMQYDELQWSRCQQLLHQLRILIDCSQLQMAFDYSSVLARQGDCRRLLQQQTLIAECISRMIRTS